MFWSQIFPTEEFNCGMFQFIHVCPWLHCLLGTVLRITILDQHWQTKQLTKQQ